MKKKYNIPFREKNSKRKLPHIFSKSLLMASLKPASCILTSLFSLTALE